MRRHLPHTDSPTEMRRAIQSLENEFFDESSDVDHDATTNFVANEHIDHTTVSVIAGTGLSGGGTIAADRTLALSHLGIESLTDPGADRILFWDNSTSACKWLDLGASLVITDTTLAVVAGSVDHGGLAGLGDDDHAIYLLADGTRALSADWTTGAHSFIGSDHWYLRADDVGQFFGAADDASISYDGADLILNPAAVGTGSVKIVLTADQPTAIHVDGATNDYTGAADVTCIYSERDIAGSGSTTLQVYGFHNKLSIAHPVVGMPFLAGATNIGQLNELRVSSDHTATPMGALQEQNIGMWNVIDREVTSTITASKCDVTLQGFKNTCTDQSEYDNAGGVYVQKLYGAYSYVYAANTLTNGSLTGTLYGAYLSVSDASDAGKVVTIYGIYLDVLSGGDTTWAFYNATGEDNFLGLDDSKTFFGTGSDASISYDGTDLVIDPKEAGAGYLSVLGAIECTNLGIPTVSANAQINTATHYTDTAGALYGINGGVWSNPGGASSANVIGCQFTARTEAANAHNHTGYLAGAIMSTAHQGTATVDECYGARFSTYNTSTGTVTSAYAIYSLAAGNTGGGTMTSVYGLYLETQAVGGTNWQVYSVSGDWRIGNDNSKLIFGTGQDASICYDGTDLLVDPRVVGAGNLKLNAGNLDLNSGNLLNPGTGHDVFTDFVGNEHIDHTSVTLTAGLGLSGGGDISANRTFDLDIHGLTAASPAVAADEFPFWDETAGTARKITFANLNGSLDHDSLSGFVSAEHVSLPNTIANVLSDHNLAAHTDFGVGSVVVENDEAGSIKAGEPVYVSSAGKVKQSKADATATARMLGLVLDGTIAASATGNVQTSGVITATTGNWDAVTGGGGGLTAGSFYYLSAATAGKLTTTPPSTVGQFVIRVGIAISTTELELKIRQRILL